MTPLAIIKYIVEYFEGKPYEAWVNAFLFALFGVAIVAAIWLLLSKFVLGTRGRKQLAKWISTSVRNLKNQPGFAPEFERFRVRVAPYIDLIGSLHFVFVGFCFAVVIALALAAFSRTAPLWPSLVGALLFLGCCAIIRVYLQQASWAYHQIKNRKG